jgi:hypothetical protein
LIRVLGGGELLEKTLASVLPSEQLDFEFTRLPDIGLPTLNGLEAAHRISVLVPNAILYD